MKSLINISVFAIFILALLSSCQIEKRHFVKGYFISKARNSMFQRNQAFLPQEKAIIVDSLEIDQASPTQIESVGICDNNSTSLFKTESCSISKANGNRTCTFLNYCNQAISKKLKLEARNCNTEKHGVPQNSLNKYHPYAILGIMFLAFSISSFLIFSFYLWATSLFVLLFFLFLLLSIGSLFLAKKKIQLTPERWSGIKLVKIILFIEVGFMLLILLGILLALPVIL